MWHPHRQRRLTSHQGGTPSPLDSLLSPCAWRSGPVCPLSAGHRGLSEGSEGMWLPGRGTGTDLEGSTSCLCTLHTHTRAHTHVQAHTRVQAHTCRVQTRPASVLPQWESSGVGRQCQEKLVCRYLRKLSNDPLPKASDHRDKSWFGHIALRCTQPWDLPLGTSPPPETPSQVEAPLQGAREGSGESWTETRFTDGGGGGWRGQGVAARQ